MNIAATFLLAVALLGRPFPCAAQEHAPPHSSPVKIMIATPGGLFGLGSPVPLKLVLTNVSREPLLFIVNQANGPVVRNVPLREMDIRVLDSDARPVPETEYGKTIHARSVQQPQIKVDPNTPGRPVPSGPRGVGVSLKPGESFTEESDLNKEFELAKPGRYTVQAFRAATSNGPGQQGVKSNEIAITIQ